MASWLVLWEQTSPALVIAGLVALVALGVWLAGLALVLRGSDPADRPSILHAYARLRLPTSRRAGGEPFGPQSDRRRL
ncbi:hypothetical protein [Actinoplanes auranticolor]|uniref:Uncharacterized protein n=1 Tax=Actinoplanes auranticolor TaxID=47988 RepID=A0A919VKE0_9ACTN|nr:hypothetical protein [Actinoplanes auranticolor]GIM66473.1 hypothetical protein Aau02nite_23090 [Actinoplanes auranticolor]